MCAWWTCVAKTVSPLLWKERSLSKVITTSQYNLIEPKLIGKNDFGKEIYLKNGRFGPYLQHEKEIELVLEKKKKKKKKTIWEMFLSQKV